MKEERERGREGERERGREGERERGREKERKRGGRDQLVPSDVYSIRHADHREGLLNSLKSEILKESKIIQKIESKKNL
jgi:hypothetical protein